MTHIYSGEARKFSENMNKINIVFGEYDYERKKTEGIGFGSSFPITGIEKFLGYYRNDINIANFPSLSITTDFARCYSAAIKSEKDMVYIDGKPDLENSKRWKKAIESFRKIYGIKEHFNFYIKRYRRYGNAKGVGESSMVAASAAEALANLCFENPDKSLISAIARLASGSGTRAATGGLSLWNSYPGIEQKKSHGVKIPFIFSKYEIGMIPFPHSVKTEGVHGLASSSPFYREWGKNKFLKIFDLLNSINEEQLVRAAEQDMLLMHSLLISKGKNLMNEKIFKIMEHRDSENMNMFFTEDTGPSIIIFYTNLDDIEEMQDKFNLKILKGKITYEKPDIDISFVKECEEYFQATVK
ncbi:hypothetical protein [Caldiplasma sukawensis]